MNTKALTFGILLLFIGMALPAYATANSATYTYDVYGRLWTVTYANGTTITYSYDNAGNLQSVVTTCSGTGC